MIAQGFPPKHSKRAQKRDISLQIMIHNVSPSPLPRERSLSGTPDLLGTPNRGEGSFVKSQPQQLLVFLLPHHERHLAQRGQRLQWNLLCQSHRLIVALQPPGAKRCLV